MSVFRKTSALALVLASSLSFAGTMGAACQPGSVSLPCANTGWDFGLRALYLNRFSGETLAANYSPEGYTLGKAKNINSAWNWGWMLEAAYRYSTGKDINLNWYHYNKNTVSRGRFNEPGYNNVGQGIMAIRDQRFADKTGWDAVNLEFAQSSNWGEHTSTRLHAGAQYSKLQRNSITDNVYLPPVNPGSSYINYVYSNYSGFGPRFGADFNYAWNNGFNLYAKAAAAVLIGQAKLYSGQIYNIAFFGPHDNLVSTTRLLEDVDVKLGANYSFALAQGNMTLDAGYLWVDFINYNAMPALSGLYAGLKFTA